MQETDVSFLFQMTKSNAEIHVVYDFIIQTCQLLPRWRALDSDHMHNLILKGSPPPNEYAIVCGSTAELLHIRLIHALQTMVP